METCLLKQGKIILKILPIWFKLLGTYLEPRRIPYWDKFWRGENLAQLAQNGKNRQIKSAANLIIFSLRQIKSMAKKLFF